MSEERKVVTVLFADIVGSTGIMAARDPEVIRRTLRRTFDEMAPIIEAHGGTVEKFIGDEVMAVFGVPRTHDDDAERAVRAAFALRERVRRLAAGAHAVPLELRVGINTGEAVAGTGGGSQFLVTGEPVNAGARIRGSAEPGEIVVGALTRRLTANAVVYGGSRSFEAKGIGRLESWPALALRSEVPTSWRGDALRAPLIGRDEELSLLLNAFGRMWREGRPHLVTVFGAAGAGKSRLMEESVERLPGVRVRLGRCLPYGEGITLWPIQQILRNEAGILQSDGLERARRRIHDAVIAASSADADDLDAVRCRLEVLAGLARADEVLPDVAAADLSEELGWGLRRFLDGRAGGEPLVLVFEDLHWAAPALLELIEHLAEWATAPLFILCLARPEFLDTRPSWGGGKVNASSIVLEPLTPEETRQMVASLVGAESIPESLKATVVERSEGNPLYVEELIRLFVDTGQIGDPDRPGIVMNVSSTLVPPTLQGLIAARIDMAPASVKRLLQRAAVIGRFFTTTGVAALGDGKLPEASDLRDAARRDLLVEADERGVGGGRVYRFKHVLIRQVAYTSVPKAERALMHDRYLRWYEEALGDRREDFIELIAHHAEQAYLLAREIGLPQTAELARRAVDRLMAAANKARVREDAGAALALYRRAAVPGGEADLSELEQLDLDAYSALMRHAVEASPAALLEVDRALERARQLRATRLLVSLLSSRWRLFGERDERERAREEIRALALSSGDPEDAVREMLLRLTETTSIGEDVTNIEEALAHARRHRLVVWQIRCYEQVLWRLRALGRFSEAEAHLREWATLIGPNPTRRQRADIGMERAGQLMDEQRFDAAMRVLDEAASLATEVGDLRTHFWALTRKGVSLIRSRRYEEAAELLANINAAVTARAMPRLQSSCRGWLAYALAHVGRLADAWRRLDEASVPSSPVPGIRTFLLHVRAIVLSAEGDHETASRLLEEVAADDMGSGSVGNDFITFDRAEVLIRAGRGAEAREILEQLREAFTDPRAELIRRRADELLARCEPVTTDRAQA